MDCFAHFSLCCIVLFIFDVLPVYLGMRRGSRRQVHRSLSVDDVANQSRLLLSRFIHDRMISDGLVQAPPPEEIIEPDTPRGNY